MQTFLGVPVFSVEDVDARRYCALIDHPQIDVAMVRTALEDDRLVLLRSLSFADATTLFQALSDAYGIRDSYNLQMQLVAYRLKDRKPVNDTAVTVNSRGALQLIQAHSEGNSTSPLDLFALYCMKNSKSGGENVLSLINQHADHSQLRAKEKYIVNRGLSAKEHALLRRLHPDAIRSIDRGDDNPASTRILHQSDNGEVIVGLVSLSQMTSHINGAGFLTYWDNVTVHDHAFHRHQHALMKHLGLLFENIGPDYTSYIHIEEDSPWAPVDTDSGTLIQTAQLFSCHVLYKLEPGDMLVLHNRAWSHSANNWPAHEVRDLLAFYA